MRQIDKKLLKVANEMLLDASVEQNLSRVKEALEKFGAFIGAKDEAGWGALHAAAYFGNDKMITYLLSKGAIVNQKTLDGSTALGLAALNATVQTVNLLISLDAEVNAQDNRGLSPLMLAADRGSAEIVDVLLLAGASVHLVDVDGKTAAQLAEDQCYDNVLSQIEARLLESAIQITPQKKHVAI